MLISCQQVSLDQYIDTKNYCIVMDYFYYEKLIQPENTYRFDLKRSDRVKFKAIDSDNNKIYIIFEKLEVFSREHSLPYSLAYVAESVYDLENKKYIKNKDCKLNPQNGKGSGRYHARTKISSDEMQSNWDRIFGKKDKPEHKETKVKQDETVKN